MILVTIFLTIFFLPFYPTIKLVARKQGIRFIKKSISLESRYLGPIEPSEMMTGLTLSNMVIALGQTAVIFVVASLMGYSPGLSLGSLLVALLTISIFSLTCIGFGLIVGIMSANEGMATGISFIFIAPMMFLGTFMTFGDPTLINKLMPSYYVTETLLGLFLRQTSPLSAAIWLNIGIVAAVSLVVYLAGVLAFKQFLRK